MAESVGLNGSEGHIYKGSAPGEPLTHAFRPEDVVGAGIVPEKESVFFTYAHLPYHHHSAVDIMVLLINRCCKPRGPEQHCVLKQREAEHLPYAIIQTAANSIAQSFAFLNSVPDLGNSSGNDDMNII
jgi:hypothetical protein